MAEGLVVDSRRFLRCSFPYVVVVRVHALVSQQQKPTAQVARTIPIGQLFEGETHNIGAEMPRDQPLQSALRRMESSCILSYLVSIAWLRRKLKSPSLLINSIH